MKNSLFLIFLASSLSLSAADPSTIKTLGQKLAQQCAVSNPFTISYQGQTLTPLMYTAIHGDEKGVLDLLNKNANPYLQNEKGFSAGMLAVCNNKILCFMHIFYHSPDKQHLLTQTSNSEKNILDYAKNTKDRTTINMINDLYKSYALNSFTFSCQEHKFTALMYSAMRGDEKEVLDLLKKNADPYLQSEKGLTAGMLAAYNNKISCFMHILNHSTDKQRLLTQRSREEKNILDYAQNTKDYTTINMISDLYKKHASDAPPVTAYFSPHILPMILKCINCEQKSVTGAMYSFTHGDPARALVAKRKKGIPIELIVEKDYTYDPTTKSFDAAKKVNLCIALQYMIRNGINIYECTLGSNNDSNRGFFNMHNKFLVFGKNAKNRPLLITGSCNFTHQAFEKSWENITIIDDTHAIQQFTKQYQAMKKSAIPLQIERCKSDRDKNMSNKDFYARKNNKVEHLV